MKRKITVAGIQIADIEGDRDHNLTRAGETIRNHPGYDLYVLPELSTSGYGKKAFQKLEILGEWAEGPSFKYFSSLSKEFKTHICYSFPRRRKPGEYTISSAVINPRGKLISLYDKLHICQFGDCSEKNYFQKGNGISPVFEIEGIRIGQSICYDIRFPELARHLTLKENISLLLHPGGWPRDEAFPTWHPFVITRAMENSIYIMSINRAGENNGGSIFCPPFVDYGVFTPKVLGKEEALLIGEIDTEHIKKIRKSYPFLQDRRSDLY